MAERAIRREEIQAEEENETQAEGESPEEVKGSTLVRT
jgi:hypothetical protein